MPKLLGKHKTGTNQASNVPKLVNLNKKTKLGHKITIKRAQTARQTQNGNKSGLKRAQMSESKQKN